MRSKTRKPKGFLEGYRLDEQVLSPADRTTGRPAMVEGANADGEAVLIKTWPRGRGDDQDLEAVWSHELRQLHRLAGYPGAGDLMPPLIDAGIDTRGYHLVLSPGQRRPLSTLLGRGAQGHWLRQPRFPANRARMWGNLRRVAQGLDLLHDQGLLHRNLDEWSVLTAGSEEPDFQLTGFEWSMRIIGPAPKAQARRRAGPEISSFDQDWLLYGLLAARLLDARPERLTAFGVSASDVAEHLSAAEVRLLRNIIGVDKLERLDGSVVISRIDEVLSDLAAETAGREAKLNLVFSLNPRSNLSAAIRTASNNEIETHDADAQIRFLEADLAEAPLLQAIQLHNQSNTRLLLQGHQLAYWISEYRLPRQGATPSWEFAYCDATASQAPAPVSVKARRSLDASALELLTASEAADKFPRVRGRVRTWEELRADLLGKARRDGPEDEIHRALVLTLFLDALFGATEVFPVEVESFDEAPSGDGVTLKLRPRLDQDREDLSKSLGLRSPAVRLKEALVGDGVRRTEWTLTETRTLGERSQTDTEWRFEKTDGGVASDQTYQFHGPSSAPHLRGSYLIPSDSIGRDVQFRRQLKALAALRGHRELLEMLADPQKRILNTHENVADDEDLGNLDSAKRDALIEIFETMPLYLVQGPPGVGKTRLVRELVRRRMKEEPTSRVLLAAQSNAAVDHLLEEVAPTLAAEVDEPLVVRCRTSERSEEHSPYEVQLRARAILKDLIDSGLTAAAPPKLRKALTDLEASSDAASRGRDKASYASKAHATRAFEGVVLRAANVVFATTNSAELERLTEERGQFDWSIIEEAGKATGGELIAPQLLSHRRLMIGDHKQLPAFGANKMRQLLETPENVRDALRVGQDFIGRSLRGEATEELLDELEDEALDLPALCGRAMGLVTLFQSLLETEFQRQSRRPSVRRIARRLHLQHRMHPVIAELVSRSFYEDEKGEGLKTHDEARARFENGSPPFSSTAPDLLPIAPVVVIDMPSVQSTPHLGAQERFPRWTNPREIDAVMTALSKLQAGPNRPTLAVLSPYSQQVERLRTRIADGRSGRLANLDGFSAATPSGEFAHTVDSFQGSEADVVVVSLVRNNDHSGLRNALGFLSDPRRMNVLLSRARWQLILVGSTEFLREVVAVAKDDGLLEKVKFLEQLLSSLADGKKNSSIAWVPFADLKGTTQ